MPEPRDPLRRSTGPVGNTTHPVRPSAYRLEPAWLEPTLAAVGAAVFAAVSTRSALEARHCRRALGVLAGVAGELAEVAVDEDCGAGREGVRLLRVAATNEGVKLTFIIYKAGTLPVGTGGVLYWRGRTAAYVTDAGTFWAV